MWGATRGGFASSELCSGDAFSATATEPVGKPGGGKRW